MGKPRKPADLTKDSKKEVAENDLDKVTGGLIGSTTLKPATTTGSPSRDGHEDEIEIHGVDYKT